MDTNVLIALITAGGSVVAAIIAILPHYLKKQHHTETNPDNERGISKEPGVESDPRQLGMIPLQPIIPPTRPAPVSIGDPVNPPEKKPRGSYDLFGFPVTAVLRWMGKEGWTFHDARKVLDAYDLQEVADGTIRTQLGCGKRGERGEPAPLTPEQVKQLEEARL